MYVYATACSCEQSRCDLVYAIKSIKIMRVWWKILSSDHEEVSDFLGILLVRSNLRLVAIVAHLSGKAARVGIHALRLLNIAAHPVLCNWALVI